MTLHSIIIDVHGSPTKDKNQTVVLANYTSKIYLHDSNKSDQTLRLSNPLMKQN